VEGQTYSPLSSRKRSHICLQRPATRHRNHRCRRHHQRYRPCLWFKWPSHRLYPGFRLFRNLRLRFPRL